MKVQKLLMDIRNKEFKLGRELQVKRYLPIEVKKTIAQSIIYECTEENNGVVQVDSVARYMAYVRHMITAHTNLEYSDEDYDVLCSTEYGSTTLLNAIIGFFEEDAQECSRILDLMTDDYMQQYTIDYTVARFLSNLNASLTVLTNNINKKMEELNILNDVDINKLNGFLNTYNK